MEWILGISAIAKTGLTAGVFIAVIAGLIWVYCKGKKSGYQKGLIQGRKENYRERLDLYYATKKLKKENTLLKAKKPDVPFDPITNDFGMPGSSD